MNEESKTPNIDPELEARIIALVLGEASDFEDQQLSKLIESRPDLAAFKVEMQRVHGMLTDVGATEFQAPAADWRLPSEKRNAVLAVIRGEATVQRAASSVDDLTASGSAEAFNSSEISSGVSSVVTSAMKKRWKWNPAYVAAALCLAAFMGLIFLPTLQDASNASSYFAEAAKEESNLSQVDFTGGASVVFSGPPRRSLLADTDVLESTLEGFKNGRSANSHSALSSLSEIRGLWKFKEAASENISSGFESSLDQNWAGYQAAPAADPSSTSAPVALEVSGPAATTRSPSPAIASPSSGLSLPAFSSGAIDLPELVADSGITWGFSGELDGERYENNQQLSPEDAVFGFYERQQSGTNSYFGRDFAAPNLPEVADAERDESGNGTLLFQDGNQSWELFNRPLEQQVEMVVVEGVLPSDARSPVNLGEQLLELNSELGFQDQSGGEERFRYVVPSESDAVQAFPGNNFLSTLGEAPAPGQQQVNGQGAIASGGVSLYGRIAGGVQVADESELPSVKGKLFDGIYSLDADMPLGEGRLSKIEQQPGSSKDDAKKESSALSSEEKAAAPKGGQADSGQADSGGQADRFGTMWDFQGNGVVGGDQGRQSPSGGRYSKEDAPFGNMVLGGKDGDVLGSLADSKGGESVNGQRLQSNGPISILPSRSLNGTAGLKLGQKVDGETAETLYGDMDDDAVTKSLALRRDIQARSQNDKQPALDVSESDGSVLLGKQKQLGQFDARMDQRRYSEAELGAEQALDEDDDSMAAVIMVEKAKLKKQLEGIADIKARRSGSALEMLNGIEEPEGMPVLKDGYNEPDAKSWSDLSSRRSKRRELAEKGTLDDLESSIVDFVDLEQSRLPSDSIFRLEVPSNIAGAYTDPPYAGRPLLRDNETEELKHDFGINGGARVKLSETAPTKSSSGSIAIAGEVESKPVESSKRQNQILELESLPSQPMRLFRSESAVPASSEESKLNRASSEKQDANQRMWRQPGDDTFGAPSVHKNNKGFFFQKQQLQEKLTAQNLNESTTKENAFSTFSLHVSDVSFKLAFAALVKGEWPDAAKIRIEEFVNAFDYGDPLPSSSEKVACQVEQSIHPFLQQRNLLRVSMKTGAAGRASSTPLRLTFLLDNSGSMERSDRQQTIRQAFQLLTEQLNPTDHVTLISFARQPRLLADSVNGTDAKNLVEVIETLPSEGGTNIEAALQLAYEKAKEHQSSDAQNRIILLTDGAVNLGNANPESLSHMVTSMRNSGIAFDAAGIVADGLNDEVLEALTRKGDGRYYLLDSEESANNDFAKQIAGALRPSAKNVKVQIEFNPKRVGRYKLLGFEKHILKKQDFRNDKVDAAEMAAAEAGVALYQFEAMPDGEGDVGSVSVRFRDLSTGQMVENKWPIPYEANAPRIGQAAESVRIAAAAALLAAKLRGEPLGESVNLKALSVLIDGLPEANRNNERIQMLRTMIQKARQLAGE